MSELTEKQRAKLTEINAVPEGQYFAAAIAVNALKTLGLVEVHPTLKNPANPKESAIRLSEAGKAAIAAPGGTTGDQPAGGAAPVSTFAIIKLARPAQGRTLDSTAYKYPFDQLQPGTAFFVEAKGDVKSPAKAFASTLATANKRFNNAVDFRRFSTRSMMGDAFGEAFKGKKGVGVFRLEEAEEAAAKAEAEKAGWK